MGKELAVRKPDVVEGEFVFNSPSLGDIVVVWYDSMHGRVYEVRIPFAVIYSTHEWREVIAVHLEAMAQKVREGKG